MSVHDDDYDPLAPPPAGDKDPDSRAPFDPAPDADFAPAPADAPVVADEEPMGDEGDGGFSDSEGIVRIWVEDGRLVRVRVSPIWYRRLQGGRTLANCFDQALLLSSLRVAQAPGEPSGEFPPEIAELKFDNLPRVNRRSIAAFAKVFEDQERRFGEALARHAENPPKPVEVSGRSKGVTVRLDRHGRAQSVSFDEAWLDDAHAGAICTHVQLAAEAAYARYRPVEPDAELAELTTERQIISAAYAAMLNNRRDS